MEAKFTWIKPPKAIEPELRAWGKRFLDALFELAVYWASVFESYARKNAKWIDRTANARQGLTARAHRAGSIMFIFLYHTVNYGIWLELAHAGKYAILMPTVEAHLTEVIKSMQRLQAR